MIFCLGLAFVAGCDDDFLEDLEEVVIVAPSYGATTPLSYGGGTRGGFRYVTYEEAYYDPAPRWETLYVEGIPTCGERYWCKEAGK